MQIFVKKWPTIAVAGLFVGASGCSHISHWYHSGFKVGPNYCETAGPVSAEWVDHENPLILSTAAHDISWWTVFNDPVLNGFVDQAYRENLDLRAAAVRISESRARRSIAVGNLFPQSQRGLANYAHAQISRNIGLPLPATANIYADGFNASWEVDFWGRYRRTIESASADLDATTESYGNALVLMISEVATNYIQLRTYEQRLVFARENVDIQQRSADLAQARFDAGTSTELDLRQAKASLAQTQALIPPLETGRRQSANQLCVLLGMPVNDLSKQLQPAPIPKAPPEVAIGIPADLLRRRPDVRRAERQVAAQSAQIGIAEADFYPRLSINGFIGYVADDFKGLFQGSSLTAFVFPSLQWNILNYGRIINNVRAQDALLQATALQYQQTVLNAGREVEDSLVQFIQSQQQTYYLEQSVSESRRAVEIAQDQFEAGIADFNRVYTTQSQLVSQQDLMVTARGNIALSLVLVYKAIGGGWEYNCQGLGLPDEAGRATVITAE
jgi:NodT family efflux transporter outer membrane factor (OMF) lipoprotein